MSEATRDALPDRSGFGGIEGWIATRKRIERALIATARRGTPISYRRLARQTGVDLGRQSIHGFAALIDEAALEVYLRHEVFVNAFVISGNNDPSRGFFKMARKLGVFRPFRNHDLYEQERAFWVDAMADCKRHLSDSRRRELGVTV